MIIVINGYPKAGKDEFCKYFAKNYKGVTEVISTVDFIKDIALECGWNGKKTPKDRKFLSDLKDLLTKWDDVPFKKVSNKIFEAQIKYGPDVVIFIHCREPQEIQKFVDKYNALTIIIRRNEVESLDQSNHADSEVLNFVYNYQISNNGTFDDLNDTVRTFIQEIAPDRLREI